MLYKNKGYRKNKNFKQGILFMSEFDDYHERMIRRENQRKTELMERSVREHLEPSLEDFDDSPVHQSTLESDKRYVARRQRSFESRKPYHALAIEHLIQFGIGRGSLLNDPKSRKYHAESIWPTRFDDISNRVDAAFFLHSPAEGNASRQDFDCPVALDITTSPDEKVIREKILLSSNDTELGYHVGFTDIRYCRDKSGERTHQTLVPKYCIGMDKTSVDNFLEHTNVPENGTPNYDRGTAALASFKIIYEISKQNELFVAPLAHKYENDEEMSDEEQMIMDRLDTVDAIYYAELQRLTKELPPYIKLALGKPNEDGTYDIEQVAALFMKKGGDFEDKTFTAIVDTTEKLYQGFEDSEQKGTYLAEQSFQTAYDKAMSHENSNSGVAQRAKQRRAAAFYRRNPSAPPLAS